MGSLDVAFPPPTDLIQNNPAVITREKILPVALHSGDPLGELSIP
jgi:hypothetical protein